MKLKFKLTNRNTGAESKHAPSRFGFEINESNTLCVRDNPQLIPRLFTGLHDAAGNEIYDGDLLGSLDEFDILPLRVCYDFGRFQLYNADGTPHCDLLDRHDYKLVIGNRWQPEFREVFSNV